jgi:hypothetical protein
MMIGVGAAAVLFSACGGDSTSATADPEATRAAFGKTVEDACAESNERQGEIFGELFADGEASLQEWKMAIPQYLPLMEDCFGQIADMEPPAGLEDEHAAFAEVAAEFIALQRQGLEAAEAGDQERFTELEGEAQGPVKARMAESASALGFGSFFE